MLWEGGFWRKIVNVEYRIMTTVLYWISEVRHQMQPWSHAQLSIHASCVDSLAWDEGLHQGGKYSLAWDEGLHQGGKDS